MIVYDILFDSTLLLFFFLNFHSDRGGLRGIEEVVADDFTGHLRKAFR